LAYGALALLYARRAPDAAPAAAALLSLYAGAGLVLSGHHWLTDVVASWALAGMVLCGLGLLGPSGGRGGRNGRVRREDR
jgi:hypothetical protein